MEIIKKVLSHDLLQIEDIESVCNIIVQRLKQSVFQQLNRRGRVVGISGGIDYSVTLALSVKTFVTKNVLGVILPESESSQDSEIMAKALAEKFGLRVVVEDITAALNGLGCYSRRDEAIMNLFSEFNPKIDKSKMGINQRIDKKIHQFFP